MESPRHPQAWLLLAAGENRQYGGNSGYEDEADVFYSWDSTVKNHAEIAVGDRIALWDKERLLGISVIEQIDKTESTKIRSRCPECGRTNISERITKSPRFKCQKCYAEFETPVAETVPVTQYQSRHDAAWTSLDGLLDGPQLRSLCLSPASQHSMRSMDWEALQDAISDNGATRAIERVASRTPEFAEVNQQIEVSPMRSGHTQSVVRVRRGQQQFRKRILSLFGERCAFTGSAPKRVLEAGHLYSYADLGEHHEHGGLMLRRDIHKLFDDGGLAVDPTSLAVDVAPELEPYPQYAGLHGRNLEVDLQDEHIGWLEKHWSEHRT
ncbi:HNH endonuclease signature motif containing protein [Demequina sp. NBRC 110054]|uniref:HNH endonuclease signature motif containing protein n=1 Tax=Demequina sp. NBRC 110054 TaxID=1570343 RepID=UPI000A01947F|nr:HNH endonuclease signature motif containing protein [Demequina sp. NBRC 110054]